jgi:hypothetical protein
LAEHCATVFLYDKVILSFRCGDTIIIAIVLEQVASLFFVILPACNDKVGLGVGLFASPP